MARKGKDEDFEDSPFAGLQTTSILREAKIFHERQLNPVKISKVLTRILYLLAQGEKFSKEETTDIFFGATKLFQSQDTHMRRLVYVLIKELEIPPDEALICINCFSKDMTSKNESFRANSIRVLAKIMDASTVSQFERFFKQNLVDPSSFIVSSTLLAGQQLFQTAPDVIKRWTNEVQSALSSKSPMVQYHALALMNKIKRQDRLALSKVVAALTKSAPKGPLARVLMIRIIGSVIDPLKPDAESLKFLSESLQGGQSTSVIYEAARTLCRLELTSAQIIPAIVALQELLTSPVPTQRFAAVRTLSEVVQKHPLAVTQFSVDLEHLITDSNRNIATLAITTLLKTGMESNVDRLMKSITGFMADITDEFKMVLVDAIKTLCLKFKHKHHTMMTFLATSLREEGGFSYKSGLVNAMLELIHNIPEAKESGLEQFCEFIEDCEFPELTIKILHVLAELGPKTSRPAIYIRFIFNRITLETASVRAAAITALAAFATAVPSLADNIIVLLKRCLHDGNDEVRDRVVLYLNVLAKHKQAARQLLFPEFEPNLKDLEYSLNNYVEQGDKSNWFDLSQVVHIDEKHDVKEEKDGKVSGGDVKSSAPAGSSNPYLELLNSIPAIKELGILWKSSEPVEMTESETEYVVNCVKHIYPNHVVFQFNITNNMEEQVLENVSVAIEAEDDGWSEEFLVPAAQLRPGGSDTAFVCLQRPEASLVSGPLSCTLKFVVKDIDSSGEIDNRGVEDEYKLEEIEVTEADYMVKTEDLGLLEFKKQWESLGDSNEVSKKYSLGLETVQAAVDAVVDLLGMRPCENSNKVPDGAQSHTLNLQGTYVGKVPVFARARLVLDPKPSVKLQIIVRSTDPAISKLLANAVR